MKFSFWLYSSNLQQSFDYYRKAFNLENQIIKNETKTFFVRMDDTVELKISNLQQPLNQFNIEVNEAPIDQIYEIFKTNQLTQTEESDPMEMACGTFSGPWEYPGGQALFLKDPDDHVIIFTEW